MIERLARLGFASIGVVYLIVGGMAMTARDERGAGSGGHHEAAQFILDKPFGKLVLMAIVAGLVGYALWRFAAAFTDSDYRGSGAKGLAIRLGSFLRGGVHLIFAYEIVRLLMHRGGGESDDAKARHWTARLMDETLGQTLIAAVGLSVVGYGAYQLYRAFESKLGKRLHLGEIDVRVRRKVVAVSRFGLASRGVVFFVIGGSLVTAALRHNPRAARGITGALRQIAEPLNGWLLALIGAGLMAYGIFALVNARYRTIRA